MLWEALTIVYLYLFFTSVTAFTTVYVTYYLKNHFNQRVCNSSEKAWYHSWQQVCFLLKKGGHTETVWEPLEDESLAVSLYKAYSSVIWSTINNYGLYQLYLVQNLAATLVLLCPCPIYMYNILSWLPNELNLHSCLLVLMRPWVMCYWLFPFRINQPDTYI